MPLPYTSPQHFFEAQPTQAIPGCTCDFCRGATTNIEPHTMASYQGLFVDELSMIPDSFYNATPPFTITPSPTGASFMASTGYSGDLRPYPPTATLTATELMRGLETLRGDGFRRGVSIIDDEPDEPKVKFKRKDGVNLINMNLNYRIES